MEIILIILLTILIVLVAVFGILIITRQSKTKELEQSINQSTQNTLKNFGDIIAKNQQNINVMQSSKLNEFNIIIRDMYDTMETRLERMNKGIGELNSFAGGIDELKKIMSNVKTRGIIGELQLGAIMNEILSHEQYETNIATVPNSSNRVEFAVKLPGSNSSPVYLPIDSKFPTETYSALADARSNSDKEAVQRLQKELSQRMRNFAKDIHTKYIEPPYTTDFGIMFLPFEGLYLEAVNLGLVEKLQHDYKINIAGPSTFAAMLNVIQMGFKTVAVEKHSAQIRETLTTVKNEFEKFSDILENVQQRLTQANTELDKLAGVRTRAINKALRDIENISE